MALPFSIFIARLEFVPELAVGGIPQIVTKDTSMMYIFKSLNIHACCHVVSNCMNFSSLKYCSEIDETFVASGSIYTVKCSLCKSCEAIL